MKTRELTCIVCPRGCALKVELSDEGAVISVSGNICKRGETYANSECTNPQRTVTSTVRCEDGEVVSCKTSTTVPKALVFDVMKEINAAVAPNDVKIGDVVISNILNTGADVIITSNR
jgi:CxxC motif-containing protein